MKNKLTLQDVVSSINNIAGTLTERINNLEDRLTERINSVDERLDTLDNRLSGRIAAIDAKTNRIEGMVHDMQKENESFHEEMRGIHKVIDKFDTRITLLEVHAGFSTQSEFEDD